MAQHARSFDRAGRFLPERARNAAAVVYAFCRLVDDAADEAPDRDTATAELDRLRRALDDEARGVASGHAIVSAFVEVARDGVATAESLGAARELIVGVESDLDEVRIPDDQALLRYCYRVAGTVGLMMCDVLGVTNPRALPYAIDLGVGMQLTNICRDVAEDAARGRIYLPATRLVAAGLVPDDLARGDAPAGPVALVVSDLLELADRYYASGLEGAPFIPWRTRYAIFVAAHLYRAIGHRLRARGSNALAGRTVVPKSDKALLLAEAAAGYVRSLRRAPAPHESALHTALAGLAGCAPIVHRHAHG